ncbi:hypothetical protein [Mycobacterium paragordonae]|uniref:hypothetical protein n=1 Tax=Mycobacterium paragordonae TaxID=1389713 RepID=UPI0012E1FECB|nr:hypothetical protein [Mycobacterium paragordonae]
MSGHELGSVFVSVVPSLAGASDAMTKGGEESASHFGKAFAGHAVWRSLFNHVDFAGMGKQHGEKWSDGVAGAVEQGSQKISKSMSGSLVAAGALGAGIGALATTAVEGFKEIFESVEKLGDKLVEIGETWEKVERTLRVHTTAMGADFESLKATVGDVAATTAADLNNIASATATLAQKTGLRGGALKDLVTDFVDAQQLLGQPINIGSFVGSLKALGIPMQDAEAWLTKLFNIARQTDLPLNTLVETMGKNANAFRQFGIDGEAAAMVVAKLGRFGDPSAIVKGLSRAAKEAASENKTFPQFLQETIEKLEGYSAAGKRVAEEKLAERVFGTKAALAFIGAIDQGVLSVDALAAAFDGPNTKISDLYDSTKTMGDEIQILKHQFLTALEPLGLAVTQNLGGALGKVSDWVKTHGDQIVSWFNQFGDIAIEVGKNVTTAFGSVVDVFGNIEKGIGLLTGDRGLQEAGQAAIDLGHKLESAGPKFDALRGKFDNFMDGVRKSTAINELLGESLKRTADGKGLTLKDNSPQVMENLKRLHDYGVEVTTGPDGQLHVSASTDDARKRVEDFLKSFTGREIKVEVVPIPGGSGGWSGAPGGRSSGSWGGAERTTPGEQGVLGGGRQYGIIGPGTAPTSTPTPAEHPQGTPPPEPHHSPLSGTDNYQFPWWLNPFLWSATGGGHDQGGTVGRPWRRPGPTDQVPAWLTSGEFVMNRDAAQRFGPLLSFLNAGGWDIGGPVGGWSLPGISGGDGDSPWTPKTERDQEQWRERQVAAARSVERGRDRIEDLQTSIEDYQATLKDLQQQYENAEGDEVEQAKITKQLTRTRQQLNRAERDLTEAQEDLQTDIRKQDQAARTPPSGTKEGGTGADSSAAAFGNALVGGIAQALGFGDVFRNFTGGAAKPPWQFGIAKIFAQALGIAFGGDGSSDTGGISGIGGAVPHMGTGAYPGPRSSPGPGNNGGGPQGSPTPVFRPAGAATGGRAGMAEAIYSAVRGAGYSDQTALYAVGASLFESGLDPDVTNSSGHKGLFQMSADKHPGDATQQISWFLGALAAAGGPGVVDLDPKSTIADKVEIGGYPGSLYDGKLGEARALLGGVVPSGYSAGGAFGGGGLGVNPATRAAALRLSGSTTNAFDAAVARGDETNAPLYRPGLNTGGYGNSAGLPQWAIDLGAQYGLAPSTYPDGGTLHQRGYAMDFAPKPGNPDPAGSMDRFAQMIAARLGPQTLELIHANASGQKWGVAGGRPVGPGTDMPGYFADDWAGHQDHVHWATDVPPMFGPDSPTAQQVPSAGYTTGGGAGGGGFGNIAGMLSNLPRALSDLTTQQWAPKLLASAMRPASDPAPAAHSGPAGPAVQINQNMSGIMGHDQVKSTVNSAMLNASRFSNSAINPGLHV